MAGCSSDVILAVYSGTCSGMFTAETRKTPGGSTSIIRGLTKSLSIVAGFFCLITPGFISLKEEKPKI